MCRSSTLPPRRRSLYEKYGDTQTNTIFFDGNGSTHLNETGAMVVARLCAQKMKEQGILADHINLNSELAVLPDSIDFGTGYKGQTLTKQAIVKGFELSPESGDITITATKGIDVSADQNTWGSTATIHYDAGMVVSPFYVKADIVSNDADINGQVTVSQGSTTITIPVSGNVVKITPGEAQDGVTTSWPLDNGTESSMSGDMSVPGLASVASMTIGSGLEDSSTAEHRRNIVLPRSAHRHGSSRRRCKRHRLHHHSEEGAHLCPYKVHYEGRTLRHRRWKHGHRSRCWRQ